MTYLNAELCDPINKLPTKYLLQSRVLTDQESHRGISLKAHKAIKYLQDNWYCSLRLTNLSIAVIGIVVAPTAILAIVILALGIDTALIVTKNLKDEKDGTKRMKEKIKIFHKKGLGLSEEIEKKLVEFSEIATNFNRWEGLAEVNHLFPSKKGKPMKVPEKEELAGFGCYSMLVQTYAWGSKMLEEIPQIHINDKKISHILAEMEDSLNEVIPLLESYLMSIDAGTIEDSSVYKQMDESLKPVVNLCEKIQQNIHIINDFVR